MSTAVIRAEGLGKRYRRGMAQTRGTLRDALTNFARAPLAVLRRPKQEVFWAMKDVSLEVREGEVLGLIGRNGAGKTTLLKILSRITRPTTGWAEIRGRVRSLLEVGTGFHGELSGRENTYLSGSILGMSKREIDRKFDEIVAFSEIDKFIDTPVKHYSSGMYVRLAFAVAAHLEPEILLIDEVLAVGDASFQQKCLGKMGDVARQGRTIVFVSHNMTAVQGLCDRVVWLDKGAVLQDGPAGSVMSAYLATSRRPVGESLWPDPKDAPGNNIVRIRKAMVRSEKDRKSTGSEPELITVRTPLVLDFEYWILEAGSRVSLSLHLFSADGSRAFNTFPLSEPLWNGKPLPVGLYRSCCHIPGDLLNNGTYRVQLVVVKNQSVELFSIEDALVFEVHDVRLGKVPWHGKILGVVRPVLDWSTERIQCPELECEPQIRRET
jgi:lipopolysaccharide transport system ATP-binding protein